MLGGLTTSDVLCGHVFRGSRHEAFIISVDEEEDDVLNSYCSTSTISDSKVFSFDLLFIGLYYSGSVRKMTSLCESRCCENVHVRVKQSKSNFETLAK